MRASDVRMMEINGIRVLVADDQKGFATPVAYYRAMNETKRKIPTPQLSPSERSDIHHGRRAINTMHRGMWFDTYDNTYSLGEALYKANLLLDAGDLLGYFEKPWKWEREWNLWETWGKPGDSSCEGWQSWIDAVEAPEDEEEADEYFARLDAERSER